MFKPNPATARQLSDDGPIALWRDGRQGREGLLISARGCENPECTCAEVQLEAWLVGEQLRAVNCEDERIEFTFAGTRAVEKKVLRASIDVHTGAITPNAKQSKGWALEWFRKECDAELLSSLRGQLAAAKRTTTPFDWRTADWSGWLPGDRVGWYDLHPDDDESDVIAVDGQSYVLDDTYCVVPGCGCDEVEVTLSREDRDGELHRLGEVTLVPSRPSSVQLQAHGPTRALLERIWEAWDEEQPIGALLHKRQAAVRELAPEFQALMAARRSRTSKTVGAPTSTVAASKPQGAERNEPCPCGSGRKFKKCCMQA